MYKTIDFSGDHVKMLENNTTFLVIKYAKTPYDCIANHIEVLKKLGYCWFGKIGSSPSLKAISVNLNSTTKYLVLYYQGTTHLCKFVNVSIEKPDEGYPEYYNTLFYKKNIQPSIYFKLVSIEPMPSTIFAKCISLSSEKPLSLSLSQSMASFFYGKYVIDHSSLDQDAIHIRKEKKPKKEKKATAAKSVDKHSCIYRKNGLCSNKRCINYQYDCLHPDLCIKQKPLPL